jgi:pyrroloquinoline quinone biosynthesis protein B
MFRLSVALLVYCSVILLASCSRKEGKPASPYLVVLGTAQDGGYPQAGCRKECCRRAWNGTQKKKLVSCLALVDPQNHQKWMFDATPDFREQLHLLEEMDTARLDGIFLTHGHIGHYTGLMNLGREVMGTAGMNVYAMPRMQKFLASNGPWSQLVSLKNINMVPIADGAAVQLNSKITVTPFLVPHRDEFTETAGYKIKGPNKTAVFIPDIDKWQRWDKSIVNLIAEADYSFIDGTFFKNGELNRDMGEVPHPFVSESMALFSSLPEKERAKIYFIHFNHTNPLLIDKSTEKKLVEEAGYKVAEEMQTVAL